MEREQVLKQFEERLREARARRDRASAHFDEAIKRIGHGQSDNFERIQAASKEYSEALAAVREAVRLQSEYLLHGALPPERKLPESEESASTAAKSGGTNAG